MRWNLTFDFPISTLGKEESSESMAQFFQKNHKKIRLPSWKPLVILKKISHFCRFLQRIPSIKILFFSNFADIFLLFSAKKGPRNRNLFYRIHLFSAKRLRCISHISNSTNMCMIFIENIITMTWRVHPSFYPFFSCWA